MAYKKTEQCSQQIKVAASVLREKMRSPINRIELI